MGVCPVLPRIRRLFAHLAGRRGQLDDRHIGLLGRRHRRWQSRLSDRWCGRRAWGAGIGATFRGGDEHCAGSDVTGEQVLFDGTYGRLRAVVESSDRAGYMTTNNRDNRGDPARGDDPILGIVPPAA